MLVYNNQVNFANIFLLFVDNIFMEKKKSKIDLLVVILFGAIIGLVNGFFGGGGGMICVPFLENILKLETKYAHATTLCVIFPLSLCSSIVYITKNSVDILSLIIITLGSLVGGIVGAILLSKLNSKWVRAIFALLMLGAGIKMVI